MASPISELSQRVEAINPQNQDTNWLGRRIRNCSQWVYDGIKWIIQKIYDYVVRLFIRYEYDNILIELPPMTADFEYERHEQKYVVEVSREVEEQEAQKKNSPVIVSDEDEFYEGDGEE